MVIALKLKPQCWKHFILGAEIVLIENVAFIMKNKIY